MGREDSDTQIPPLVDSFLISEGQGKEAFPGSSTKWSDWECPCTLHGTDSHVAHAFSTSKLVPILYFLNQFWGQAQVRDCCTQSHRSVSSAEEIKQHAEGIFPGVCSRITLGIRWVVWSPGEGNGMLVWWPSGRKGPVKAALTKEIKSNTKEILFSLVVIGDLHFSF